MFAIAPPAESPVIADAMSDEPPKSAKDLSHRELVRPVATVRRQLFSVLGTAAR
ncbi:MAG: hypothetical protein ACRD8O_00430 [Bryobacteraceae bacterium]